MEFVNSKEQILEKRSSVKLQFQQDVCVPSYVVRFAMRNHMYIKTGLKSARPADKCQ